MKNPFKCLLRHGQTVNLLTIGRWTVEKEKGKEKSVVDNLFILSLTNMQSSIV